MKTFSPKGTNKRGPGHTKMIAAFILLPLVSALILASCKKTMPSGSGGNDSVVTDFNQVFEEFWNKVNTNYVYWDTDTTDWDGIYRKFRPLFATLNLNDSSDRLRSAGYFRQMTYSLRDAHFQVIFNAAPLTGINLYPAAERKQSSPGFHLPYDYTSVDASYFDPGYRSVYDSGTITSSGPLHVLFASIQKKMIYFSCNGFALRSSYNSAERNAVRPILDSLFALLKDSASAKGIILDVRNNYGGDLDDLGFLVGRLIDKPLQFGYSSYKSGPGRLDYTPWIPSVIDPQPGSRAWPHPVIVLMDNFSVSLSEAVAMAVHSLPNGILVGERTWGATGPLVSTQVYNAGSFSIPGFLTAFLASARFNYIDNKSYEGIGFSPDLPVPFNIVSLEGGRDPVLEKAISLIP